MTDTDPTLGSSSSSSRPTAAGTPWRDPILAALLAALVAAVVVVATVVSGSMDSSNVTLVLMGFDQDRAQLITSLLVGAVAAAAATLIGNRILWATLAGFGGGASLFAPTFMTETRNAQAATGIGGTFDPAGWLLTLLTLATVCAIAGWAGATLGGALRPGLEKAGSIVVQDVRHGRPDRRLLRAPLAVAVVLALLFVTMPVFGDMVNYTPDSHMLDGGAPLTGLGGPQGGQGLPSTGATASSASGTRSTNPSPRPTADGKPSGKPSGTPSGTPTPIPSLPSWVLSVPTGSGSVRVSTLPAPWIGGTTTTINIYTPPGYNPKSALRYPVLYEAGAGFEGWESGSNITATLDSLIDSGVIPPVIAVFIGSTGAPYPDTQCADSVDGKQWFDTFISQTVVAYVDSHYPTVASPNARGTMGFSIGGYCATILELRHPTVFGTAISISGYYEAGKATPTAGLPFGGNKAALAAASPLVVATRLPQAERPNVYFIVIADPSQSWYGPEASSFDQVLANQGYPYLVQNARIPHGWDQVRRVVPAALKAWGIRMIATGVFAS